MKTLPAREWLQPRGKIPHDAAISQDTARLIEDHYKLELASCLLRDVDPDSVNEWLTGDVGDRHAVEGLLLGTIQQVRHWGRIAWGKIRKLYAQ